jgi:hypothetical protein
MTMLVEQNLEDLRRRHRRHDHLYRQTRAYYEGEIGFDALPEVAGALAATDSLVADQRTCVLFGYGSQPRSLYLDLMDLDAVDVLWHAPMLPLFAYPLALISWSYGGLVCLRESQALTHVLTHLAEGAMVELYSFPRQILQAVRGHVRWRRWRARIGRVVGRHPGHFCWGLDGGYGASCPAWCSWGEQCPTTLRDAVGPFLQSA